VGVICGTPGTHFSFGQKLTIFGSKGMFGWFDMVFQPGQDEDLH
jgi:hypothetical protein